VRGVDQKRGDDAVPAAAARRGRVGNMVEEFTCGKKLKPISDASMLAY